MIVWSVGIKVKMRSTLFTVLIMNVLLIVGCQSEKSSPPEYTYIIRGVVVGISKGYDGKSELLLHHGRSLNSSTLMASRSL